MRNATRTGKTSYRLVQNKNTERKWKTQQKQLDQA